MFKQSLRNEQLFVKLLWFSFAHIPCSDNTGKKIHALHSNLYRCLKFENTQVLFIPYRPNQNESLGKSWVLKWKYETVNPLFILIQLALITFQVNKAPTYPPPPALSKLQLFLPLTVNYTPLLHHFHSKTTKLQSKLNVTHSSAHLSVLIFMSMDLYLYWKFSQLSMKKMHNFVSLLMKMVCTHTHN